VFCQGRHRFTCPFCNGGKSQEVAFDCDVGPELLWWRCYRGKCGKHGAVTLSGMAWEDRHKHICLMGMGGGASEEWNNPPPPPFLLDLP